MCSPASWIVSWFLCPLGLLVLFLWSLVLGHFDFIHLSSYPERFPTCAFLPSFRPIRAFRGPWFLSKVICVLLLFPLHDGDVERDRRPIVHPQPRRKRRLACKKTSSSMSCPSSFICRHKVRCTSKVPCISSSVLQSHPCIHVANVNLCVSKKSLGVCVLV